MTVIYPSVTESEPFYFHAPEIFPAPITIKTGGLPAGVEIGAFCFMPPAAAWTNRYNVIFFHGSSSHSPPGTTWQPQYS